MHIINTCKLAVIRVIYEICRDYPNFDHEFYIEDVLKVLEGHQELVGPECEYKNVSGILYELVQEHAVFDLGNGKYRPNPERILYATNLWWKSPQ